MATGLQPGQSIEIGDDEEVSKKWRPVRAKGRRGKEDDKSKTAESSKGAKVLWSYPYQTGEELLERRRELEKSLERSIRAPGCRSSISRAVACAPSSTS